MMHFPISDLSREGRTFFMQHVVVVMSFVISFLDFKIFPSQEERERVEIIRNYTF